jgi:hypothetical protein
MTSLSDDLQTLSYEATTYFFPLVLMDITRRQSLNTAPDSSPGRGRPNVFHHIRTYPTADFRGIVRPNFDTLYSIAWLDLTAGPVVVHAPDTHGRYYMLSMLDMWTDVFANPGTRTTGTTAQAFTVVPPGYRADLVADNMSVIAAPTPHVWVIGRTQTDGPQDYSAVHKIQDGYGIAALDQAKEHPIDGDYDVSTEPLRIVCRMDVLQFLDYATDLFAINPPHLTDASQLHRIARLGIVRGKPFNPSRFSPDERTALEAGWKTALHSMVCAATCLGTCVNGWNVVTDTMGVYGNNYARRATVALVGLGANPSEDAVYPLLSTDAAGEPLIGENDYVMHFEPDQLPPTAAFWSVTMYDGEGYHVDNELNRFALADRDPLTFNPDGSLDIYLQHRNPGRDREPNWLPAPRGPLGVTMRIYAPQRSVFDGTWTPPPVRRT